MAGHVRYTALLDACVLYPTTVADALMSLSVAGLFAAKWTVAIENEFIAALEQQKPELTGRVERRRSLMRAAIPDWEVVPGAYEALVPCLSLPDPNDVHVLAAAIAGHADCIVTANLKHFPDDVLAIHGLEVIHPDDFCIMQLDIDPGGRPVGVEVNARPDEKTGSDPRGICRVARALAALFNRAAGPRGGRADLT